MSFMAWNGFWVLYFFSSGPIASPYSAFVWIKQWYPFPKTLYFHMSENCGTDFTGTKHFTASARKTGITNIRCVLLMTWVLSRAVVPRAMLTSTARVTALPPSHSTVSLGHWLTCPHAPEILLELRKLLSLLFFLFLQQFYFYSCFVWTLFLDSSSEEPGP